MVQPSRKRVRLSRRRILSSLCATGGVLLAGCVNEPDASNETDGGDATAGDGGQTTPPDSTQSVPELPEDTASDACPSFESAERVVCYEAVDPEATPIVLAPESRSVRSDRSTGFTLRNRSEQRFETNFYHWQLYKRADGDWYYIAPQSWPEPLTPLAAGDEHTWTVTVANGRVGDGDSVEPVEGTESLTLAGLGGGHYAFGADGWFAAGSYEDPIALAAGFELEADPLQLRPTAAIAETERDGETLVARSTRGEPDGDGDRPDAFVLERVDGSETDAERVIVEQVVRNDQLRDAIALSRERDADRVRLEEFSNSIPPFGLDDARTYEFRDERYRVTTRAGDDGGG
ncbi:hypothetical protein ACFQMF_08355 [Halorubrum rutilum]|uniref:Uncharacterized protein n=1 Tax=Halorubrum rutilum TaxID=1364933 RepID=A0ABD6AKB9_9EURY|nr:hypothetical protein [Halorubrum rutilum]